MVRQATPDDLDAVCEIAGNFRDELGFVMRVALERSLHRGELLVAEQGGKVVGFCEYHQRHDGWKVIYHIATVERGWGRELVEAVGTPVRLKCPVELPANNFYNHIGFKLVNMQKGKKRDLNVWEKGALL